MLPVLHGTRKGRPDGAPIVYRGDTCFVLMNLFPLQFWAPAHYCPAVVSVSDYTELTDGTHRAGQPDGDGHARHARGRVSAGFNLGMNQG